jgi:hypothetical protein
LLKPYLSRDVEFYYGPTVLGNHSGLRLHQPDELQPIHLSGYGDPHFGRSGQHQQDERAIQAAERPLGRQKPAEAALKAG